jgi:DNA (cytosine-5)-methyltransferase 1
MLRHVDLCSGIGGFALGFEWAGLSRPVLFCDIEPWSRKVLKKHWPDVPIAEDVKELANDPDRNVPDCSIITAGYPCQPFSVAGARRGTEDDRHIWPEIFTIIKAKRPTFCVFENVYGHVSMGLDEVLSDLEGQGYATRPFIIPAVACDAPHRRDRVWIIGRNVGNTEHNGSSATKIKRGSKEASDNNTQGQIKTSQSKGASQSRNSASLEESPRSSNVADTDYPRQSTSQGNGKDGRNKERNNIGWSGKDVADTKRKRQQGSRPQGNASDTKTSREGQTVEPINGSVGGIWKPEPPVGRVAHGIPRRVDRLRGLGNAIVPQIAQRIGETIKKCS